MIRTSSPSLLGEGDQRSWWRGWLCVTPARHRGLEPGSIEPQEAVVL